MAATRPDNSAFWYFGENELPYAYDPSRAEQARALLVYSTLFEHTLFIPDSYAVNNANLRRFLAGDGLVRELVDSGYLRVAVRKGKSLADVHNGFLEEVDVKKKPWHEFLPGRHFRDEKEYRCTEQVAFLDRHASKVEYDLGNSFTPRFLARLQQQVGQQHNEPLALSVRQALEQFAAEQALLAPERRHNNLLRAELVYKEEAGKPPTLGKAQAQLAEGVLKGHPQAVAVHRLIEQVANGCYIVALPSALGHSPIYPEDYATAIEVIREEAAPRLEQVEGREEFRIDSLLSPVTFVALLVQLTIKDILSLHASPEWAGYRDAVANPTNRAALVKAYKEYLRKVEEAVLRRALMAAPRSPYTLQLDVETFAILDERSKEDGVLTRLQRALPDLTDVLADVSGVPFLGTLINCANRARQVTGVMLEEAPERIKARTTVRSHYHDTLVRVGK